LNALKFSRSDIFLPPLVLEILYHTPSAYAIIKFCFLSQIISEKILSEKVLRVRFQRAALSYFISQFCLSGEAKNDNCKYRVFFTCVFLHAPNCAFPRDQLFYALSASYNYGGLSTA